MPGSEPDRFVAFVDRLAVDLDAIPTRAEEMAAAAHLSRFHFERVIAAIAGESPTRFRTRILLERAAYRMTTTDATLLDIAVEAGYSSNEAFTRAFRRDYGVAPSTWRRWPARFRIPAPNDVHFHPPAGLRLPARHRMDSVDLVVEMVEHHVWVVDQLVGRAAGITDEQLDEPYRGPVDGIDGDGLRWTLSRLIGQMGMWCAAMADGAYDFAVERDESVASMRRRLASTGPAFVAEVRKVAEEGRFDETFVDAFAPEPMVMTYGAMVAHVLTFAAHHRLLAVAKLREFGITDLGYGDPKPWFNRRVSESDQVR
ncbi:MAG: helix-turn-helix domain-containing protein [Terrabacter sp.]|nr:helix-turn-helix domain-containing protein [Terrabacter sp.]